MFKGKQPQAKSQTPAQRTRQQITDEVFGLLAEMGELEYNYQMTAERQAKIKDRLSVLQSEAQAIDESHRKANEAAVAAAKANTERVKAEEAKLAGGNTQNSSPTSDGSAALN